MFTKLRTQITKTHSRPRGSQYATGIRLRCLAVSPVRLPTVVQPVFGVSHSPRTVKLVSCIVNCGVRAAQQSSAVYRRGPTDSRRLRYDRKILPVIIHIAVRLSIVIIIVNISSIRPTVYGFRSPLVDLEQISYVVCDAARLLGMRRSFRLSVPVRSFLRSTPFRHIFIDNKEWL